MPSSVATLLFRNLVQEPSSPSSKPPVSLPIRDTDGNHNVDMLASGLATSAGIRQLNRTIRSRMIDRTRFKDDHHDTCMYIERSKNLNVVAYQANLVDSKTGAAVESGAQKRDCDFKASDPLHAYWIKIEPEHVARRRARGETEDLCELNMVERKLAYGCNATLLSKDKFMQEVLPDKASRTAATVEEKEAIDALHDAFQPCLCKFVALSSWQVWMVRLTALVEGGTSVASAAVDTDDEASRGAAEERDDGAFPTGDTVVAMLALVEGELSVVQKVYVSSIEPKHFYQLPKVEYIEVHGTSLATGKATYEKRAN